MITKCVFSSIQFTLLLIIAGTSFCFSQTETDLEQQLETTAEQGQQHSETVSWLEDLLFFREHPINLNDASKEDLQTLHILTDIQISHLFSHIERNGKLLIIYELQTIEGFDQETIQKLLPYVHIHNQSDSPFPSGSLLKGNHTFVLRGEQVLEKQTGFRKIDSLSLFNHPNSRYIGSPQQLYVNYRYSFLKTLRAEFTAEKDPGELFFRQNRKADYAWYNHLLSKHRNGFDRYSAYLFVQNIKQVKALVIGDYVLTFGQGLTLWNGFSLGKSSDMLYAKKNASGIKPFTSNDENRFMRGLAGSVRWKHLVLSSFFSRMALDANVQENGHPISIPAFQQTGIHSTPSELKDKHSVVQILYGGHLHYQQKRLSVGIIGYRQQLSIPLQKATAVSGWRSLRMGVDYEYIIRNAHIFGEVSRANGGMAFLTGLFLVLDSRLSVSALHRYYQANFENNLSSGFSEGSTSNEKGLYLNATLHLNAAIQITAGVDRFSFFQPIYQVDAPSSGNDLNLQWRYTPSKRLTASMRIRQLHREKNTQQLLPVKTIASRHTRNYRFQLNYQLTPALELRNRMELLYDQFQGDRQHAYLLYQDVIFHAPGKTFALSLRYALFDTDGYESRVYTFEQELPGAYAIPAYDGRGMRFYILLHYSFTKHLECWLRYSRTTYDNKNVIGEGTLSEIFGTTKSELKVQLQVKL
jgi:hypothetical protein